jgi:hypothetical protein
VIIEIESFWGDCLLHGPKVDYETLQAQVQDLFMFAELKDFLKNFCARFGYEPLLFNETVRVDYVIDLDIYHIYKPRYQ